MNLEKWNKIYKKNQDLDQKFYEKFNDDDDIFRKNCIELLVELGEFVNETKVFKYWSIKKPNKEKLLEELADTITMCLTFCSVFKLELQKEYPHLRTNDSIEIINYLYLQCSLLMDKPNKELICDILGNLLYLKTILKINDDEIVDAIEKKHKIIEERLNSDY